MTIPNFIICGAPKAGTTSLYERLKKHPDIYMSSIKETDYFQHNYDRGIDWFKNFFQEYSGQKAIGEASPGNMAHPLAPERIFNLNNNAKLIFILRNPIERAYSQYWYGIYRGDKSCLDSFSDLIRDKNNDWGKRIIELGNYYEHIIRFDRFFPDNQLKIILYEDFRDNFSETIGDIYNFLGVDCISVSDEQSKTNQTYYPKNFILYKLIYTPWLFIEKRIDTQYLDWTKDFRKYIRSLLYGKNKNRCPKMKIEDRAYLQSLYQESILNLSRRLNKDLSHWK